MKTSRSIILILLFLFNITIIESTTACDPISNSCCCFDLKSNHTTCDSNNHSSTNCCSEKHNPIKEKQANCLCGTYSSFPSYTQTILTSLPEIQTDARHTPNIIEKLQLTNILTNPNQRIWLHITSAPPPDNFTLSHWPTICITC